MENSSLKILIVEDEYFTSSNLKSILTKEGYQVGGIAKSANEALIILQNSKIDLLILDINIDGEKDGIWLANEVKSLYNIPFIFLTAYTDKHTILKATRCNPYAYMVKPFTNESIFTSIEIAITQFNNDFKQHQINDSNPIEDLTTKAKNTSTKDFIFIKDSGIYQKIKYDKIMYAIADMKYIEIYVENEKRYTFRSNLIDFMNSLPTNIFYRPHRSSIVNLNYIDSIGSNYLVIGKDKIPMASKHKKELLELLELN